MGDREVDQQLVLRAQRGDKRAFELLVMKYQRKLGRLLSRWVRDPAEVEDVTQEAFIKAYRALPSFRGDSAFGSDSVSLSDDGNGGVLGADLATSLGADDGADDGSEPTGDGLGSE